MVLLTGLAPALATPSTSCLYIGLQEYDKKGFLESSELIQRIKMTPTDRFARSPFSLTGSWTTVIPRWYDKGGSSRSFAWNLAGRIRML